MVSSIKYISKVYIAAATAGFSAIASKHTYLTALAKRPMRIVIKRKLNNNNNNLRL